MSWPSLGSHALEESVLEESIKGSLDVHCDHCDFLTCCEGCFHHAAVHAGSCKGSWNFQKVVQTC
jgi:sulfatase maturation enzyme AslB (radical SAM superfamily)